MQTDPALEGKHLFIEHLAQALEAMEAGRTPLNPVAYRLYARRLREAMAGCPEAPLAARLAGAHPVVAETLAERYFNIHGWLPPTANAEFTLLHAKALLKRLQKKPS